VHTLQLAKIDSTGILPVESGAGSPAYHAKGIRIIRKGRFANRPYDV
jgi:hypothetical protein